MSRGMYRDGYGKLWVSTERGDQVMVDEKLDRQIIDGVMYINDPGPILLQTYVSWEDVDVELPKRVKPVLITDGQIVCVAYRNYDGDEWVYIDYPGEFGIITHWANYPLPPASEPAG